MMRRGWRRPGWLTGPYGSGTFWCQPSPLSRGNTYRRGCTLPREEGKGSCGERGRLVVSHSSEDAFEGGGLRSFFAYRDLGIRDATEGRVGAHVIKARQAVGRASGPHSHSLQFQMVYVLKGRVKFWYEGEGEVELHEGSSVYQPPGIAHEIREGSEDLEMLEITLPADFTTTDLPTPSKKHN